MAAIEIIQKDGYLLEQKKLIDIFQQHVEGDMQEFPVIFKMPNIPNKSRNHINRIPCKTIGKQGDYMLVRMEVVDFVRLMVKSGIEVKIYDY